MCFSPFFYLCTARIIPHLSVHPCVRLYIRQCTRQSSLELNHFTNGSEEGGSSPFGPLTQRLVAALIEENIMTPLDDSTELEKGRLEILVIFNPKRKETQNWLMTWGLKL